MPRKRAEPTREDLKKDEREIGENIPDEMVGLDTEDVREVGWAWLQTDERAREDVQVWQRLLESPYDNVRLRLVAMLEDRAKEPAGAEAFSPGRAVASARCAPFVRSTATPAEVMPPGAVKLGARRSLG